jgi:outer membrane protein, multidrug efflux system
MEKMKNNQLIKIVFLGLIILGMHSCRLPNVGRTVENRNVPASFSSSLDTNNSATVKWKSFFTDSNLNALIDTALKNNQELNITLQEIQIAMNEVRARKGEYLPFLNIGGAAGLDKVSRYTSRGASDDITQIAPGKATPEVLPDYMLGIYSSWEVDI